MNELSIEIDCYVADVRDIY